VAAPVSAITAAPAPKAAAAGAGAGTAGAAGAGGGSTNPWANVVSSIFSGSGANAAGAASGAGKTGGKGGTTPATGNAALSANGTPGAAPGATPAAAPPAAPVVAGPPVAGAPTRSRGDVAGGALGFAQYKNTILTVYGCTRQGSGTQVSCDTDLSNQDQANTQLGSDTQWSDIYAIDDRGDRHNRSMGFFMNDDGEKRMNMDISYGDSARYVLVFNNISAKATSLSLHSTNGGLDVEQISIANGGSAAGGVGTAAADASQASPAAGAAPAAASSAPQKRSGTKTPGTAQ